MTELTLNITEMFASVQGESSWAGLPCSFIRLTGCPLRCRWCDTVYSFHGGKKLAFSEIFQQVADFGLPLVEVTGGEPLSQAECIPLLEGLVERGYQVLIETSGALSIQEIPSQVNIILDLKCPDSGMADKNLWSNLELLKPTDEIKFVLASRADFEWATKIIQEHRLDQRFRLLFSPAWGLLQPKQLVEWILAEKVKCRLNLQQHKYIWGPRAKGV